MDIAAFIIELLTRQGILVVPGLGTFINTRIDGHYNKDQQQFFPPAQQIQFQPEYTDDNVLANLIAKQRQISVASAKYFIEKFVIHIKDQAEVGTATFGNIGLFSTRRGSLLFTPNELNNTDEQFYGLAPVKLRRNNSFKQAAAVVITPPSPVDVPLTEPQTVPSPLEQPVIAETTIEPEGEEFYEEEEETARNKVNIWLVLALIIVLAGIGIIGAYEYKPALFIKFKPLLQHLKHKTQPAPAKLSAADSLKQVLQKQKDLGLMPTKTDTSTPVDTFRIVVSQFKTLNKANSQSDIYIKKGFSAEVHKPDNSKFYQVTVGTYTNNDSLKAALPLLKQKLKLADVQIQTYPFKKQ